MYSELILEYAQGNDSVKIQPPCPESEIDRAEKEIGYRFPRALRELLRELNGDQWLLMSAQEMIEHVKMNREGFLPFFEQDTDQENYLDTVERFLYFARNGFGDYYCYRVGEDGGVDESTIYFWDHEELGQKSCWRHPVARDIPELIRRYYRDEI